MEGTPYVFLDESGDFNFSETGSRYFLLTSVTARRPFSFDSKMSEYRYELLEEGVDIDHFHCVQDSWAIRNRVFELIVANLNAITIDCLVVDKAKTNPTLRPPRRFYPGVMGYLLANVLREMTPSEASRAIVVTDRLPMEKGRKVVEKTIRDAVPAKMAYAVCHHPSRSHFGLQVADYCAWAIQRRWEKGDTRSYMKIREAVRSELEVFRSGTTRYY